MSSTSLSPWVVLKFGGTSVSTVPNWNNIAAVTRKRLGEGVKPVIVHSALSKITDKLEALLAGAMRGDFEAVMAEIARRHRDLAGDMGIPVPSGVERHLSEIRQIAAGIALVGEVSDRVRARVMSTGELMATELGAAYLNAQGIPTTLVDARTLLRAEERLGATEKASLLSATCGFDPDPALQERLATLGTVILTQGFIASDSTGNTVLLGRGGSDTSGAYLAGLLAARRLEIWTDVPGMFSANPRDVPTARLLKSLHYDEAQEIASNGAKVLHPRCVLPVRQHGIPLYVYATQTPDFEGTVISSQPADAGARVKAVALKKGITLVSLESPGMWHQVGFLADAFQVFKAHGLSVDLVSTSETNVTVSLDPAANTLDGAAIDALLGDLSKLCRAQIIGPCASLSLVGRNIRGILHKLGDALALFEEQRIYLVSQAANDLNFTFVIDEDQGDRLVTQLHDMLIHASVVDHVMGPTWEQLYAPQRAAADREAWWHARRPELLQLMDGRDSAYVYDGASVDAAAAALRAMPALARVFYAMKANPHAEVLRRVVRAGLGLECVSRGEIEHAEASVPGLTAEAILFTPNFAPRDEYAWALERGLRLNVDNLYVLKAWPSLFRDREIGVRVDTGHGHGHHQHVRTAGVHAKFGVPLFELEELARAAAAAGARVTALHAHAGSGVFDISTWEQTARTLAAAAQGFPDVRVLDIGGGIGVPERAARAPVDLAALNHALERFKSDHPRFELWMEPGRYLVAEAGVLLARVTQLKGKGDVQYVGVATGMNSLIRPALYGAYHEIVNLTRLAQNADRVFNVVGPICETADQLGHDRLLPETIEGDVLLIGTAGAYGRAMSSSYNLREPAAEFVL
jgi:diaminopimelate decarboxylase/aspartate kinase